MDTNNKRKLRSGIMAALLILLTGTYAWTQFNNVGFNAVDVDTNHPNGSFYILKKDAHLMKFKWCALTRTSAFPSSVEYCGFLLDHNGDFPYGGFCEQ